MTASAQRRLEAGAAVLVVAGLVVWARSAQVLQGWPALVALILLLVAVPASRELSRRALLMGCLSLGWVPVLWWVPLPVAGLGRTGLLLAALAAGLAGFVFRGPGRADRARRLVPRVRAVDALPVLAGLAAAAVVRPWLRVASGDGALAMLMRGWDHSAHYDIVHMLRTHGVVIGSLGPALLDDSWSYGQYPQGFHAVAATVMELEAGVTVGSARAEVLLYTQSLGVLAVIGTTVLAAGICALPRLRRRPLVAAPVVAVASGALLLGPGGRLLSDGFPNFALACVLLACLPLLVLPLDKGPLPVHLAAIGGALVGIAHGWVLLLAMALPAVVLVLMPGRRNRFLATRSAWTASIVVLVATGFAVSVAVVMVAGQAVGEVLVIPGAISAPGLRLLLGPAALAILVCAAVLVRVRRGGPRLRGEALRTAALAGVPLVGLVVAGGIAGLQLGAGQGLGYYFWKFAIALAMVSLVCAAVAAAWLLPPHLGLTSRPWRAWVAAGVVTLGATQMYGLVLPAGLRPGVDWVPPGVVSRAELAQSSTAPAPVTDHLWAAAAAAPTLAPGYRHVFLGYPPEGGVSPVAAGQWYNALSGRWTDQANEALRALFAPTTTPAEVAQVAAQVLTADADAVVIVDPDRLVELRPLVPAAVGERLVSW